MNRALIEAALADAGGSHTFEDVVEAVEKGEAQYWPGPNSCIVTTIDEQPRQKILHFFLGAGVQAEIAAMFPGILEWGKEEGCTKARFVGRKGWRRSFLPKTGWVELQHIIMEKPL